MKIQLIGTGTIPDNANSASVLINDHILFDKGQNMIYFRDTKTGNETSKNVASLSFMRNMGKIYNIYDIYKAIYKNENVEDIYDKNNPSS